MQATRVRSPAEANLMHGGAILTPVSRIRNRFYVTDGNIMYLTGASRFLISCVIQHYALVVGWGVEEQMHNVDYVPGP